MGEVNHPLAHGDTIAAIATAAGPGGIGIIRISGPEAWRVGRRVFRPKYGRQYNPREILRKLVLGHAVDPVSGEHLDQVLAVFFQAPHSYTTENTVEIHSHAGPAVTARVLQAALAAGARLARPGEFTYRALMGGRLDLSAAEAVAQLIAARSTSEARLALAGLEGGLARQLKPVRQALLGAAAAVEAAVDFPDEVDDILTVELAEALAGRVIAPLEHLVQRATERRIWRQGAVVALVGRPNVGKSTLFNAVLGQHRAITSQTPGTTRDAIEEAALIGSVVCRLVDTAGLAQAGDHLENLSQEMTRQALSRADLVLLVLDGSAPLTAEDRQLMAETSRLKRVVAVNKSDLPSASPPWEAGTLEAGVAVSALTGSGMEELLAAVAEALTGGQPEPAAGEAVASARQGQALECCLKAARRAAVGLRRQDPQPELISLELAEALAALGEVDGQGAPEEVFEAVFSQFCLGK